LYVSFNHRFTVQHEQCCAVSLDIAMYIGLIFACTSIFLCLCCSHWNIEVNIDQFTVYTRAPFRLCESDWTGLHDVDDMSGIGRFTSNGQLSSTDNWVQLSTQSFVSPLQERTIELRTWFVSWELMIASYM